MNELNDKAMRELADAIVEQAATDLRQAIRYGNKSAIKEIEQSMRTAWFQDLHNLNIDYVIKECHKMSTIPKRKTKRQKGSLEEKALNHLEKYGIITPEDAKLYNIKTLSDVIAKLRIKYSLNIETISNGRNKKASYKLID